MKLTDMEKELTENWDHLRTFLAIQREGSLRGAARALSVNHATIKRRLSQLEQYFGSKLFDRLQDGYSVTQAGEELILTAENMENSFLNITRKIAGRDSDLRGKINLNFPPALLGTFLVKELSGFTSKHPEIELNIDISYEFTDLNKGEADITIRLASEVTEDVSGRKIIDYSKAIYCSPAFISEEKQPVWIGWGALKPYPNWQEDTPFPDIPVKHGFFSNQLQLEAAKEGMGYALLPCFLGDLNKELIRVPGTGLLPGKAIWILFHSDLQKTARIRAFVDYIVPAIKKHSQLINGKQYGQISVLEIDQKTEGL